MLEPPGFPLRPFPVKHTEPEQLIAHDGLRVREDHRIGTGYQLAPKACHRRGPRRMKGGGALRDSAMPRCEGTLGDACQAGWRKR